MCSALCCGGLEHGGCVHAYVIVAEHGENGFRACLKPTFACRCWQSELVAHRARVFVTPSCPDDVPRKLPQEGWEIDPVV